MSGILPGEKFSGNPIIRNKFSADPCVLVCDDTVFLYSGHDNPPRGVDDYFMHDWLRRKPSPVGLPRPAGIFAGWVTETGGYDQ